MAREIELSTLDLRYEGFRLKQAALEERLLASMARRGIEEPLEGVEVQERSVLLNGFKRYRCARKLRLTTAPYASLGSDETAGILGLLRTSPHRALGILEQAAFLGELRRERQWSVGEIAAELSRSKSWVSMRLGLLAEMSGPVRRELFAGAFPVYSYMYTLRQFRRMNGVGAAQIEEFVVALWIGLLVYLLLRFLAWLSDWSHSFTRLFTLVRTALWRQWDLLALLKSYGTAGGSFRFLAAPAQASLPGFSP